MDHCAVCGRIPSNTICFSFSEELKTFSLCEDHKDCLPREGCCVVCQSSFGSVAVRKSVRKDGHKVLDFICCSNECHQVLAEEMPHNQASCKTCGKVSPELESCERCGNVEYCSEECRNEDLGSHTEVCVEKK